jgi:uncharacterized protein (DUF2141 family)
MLILSRRKNTGGWWTPARASPALLLLGVLAIGTIPSGSGVAAASPVLAGAPGLPIVPGDAPMSGQVVARAPIVRPTGSESRSARSAARTPVAPSPASNLKVTIEAVRSDAGTIMIGLYDTSDGFLAAIKHSTEVGLLNDKGRVVGAALRAAAGPQSIIFTQLGPGHCAVIVFHDENDNGRLDENPWGVPSEGCGFSNDAEGLLGSPSFGAAGVSLDQADKSIVISLNLSEAALDVGAPGQAIAVLRHLERGREPGAIGRPIDHRAGRMTSNRNTIHWSLPRSADTVEAGRERPGESSSLPTTARRAGSAHALDRRSGDGAVRDCCSLEGMHG